MFTDLTAAPLWLSVPLLGVLAFLAIAGATAVALRDPSPTRRRPGAATATPAPSPETPPMPADPTDPYGDMPDTHLLAPAPTATTRDDRIVTLAEWLRRESGRDGVWVEVTAQFYERAAAVPAVAAYFGDVDMSRLQRHFVAALVMVSSRGVTVGTVRRMGAVHSSVSDTAGRPITDEIWVAVIGTLVGVLAEHGVPQATLGQLGATVAPLRAAIVSDLAPSTHAGGR